ncbi:MAG: TIGR04295 family B12-binding domain-containing radical SAM protein [Minicystis sp.]
MKVALVNPPWSFKGSIYFGCREPHLPLELAYSVALLSRAGHEARIVDGQARGLTPEEIRAEVTAMGADAAVITTAPSYLFWRCAPPELRVPQEVMRALRGAVGLTIAVGPHASTTPRAVLRKLGADVAVLGECEEVLPLVCDTPRAKWGTVPSVAFREGDDIRVTCGPRASDLAALPPLTWDRAVVEAHAHHHHRFDQKPEGPGAEIEASRGCPYHCTFCAKDEFRDRYRRRPLSAVLTELDGLIAQGVRYVYFIDEIFLPDAALLEAVAQRDVIFGVQMRIDNWSKDMLDLLGRAGCVSIEAGVESVTPEGRSLLDKRCRMSTADLVERLVHAKKRVPFVQANLLESASDPPAEVAAFRDELRSRGVWANDPVPLFPYPGSPEYRLRFGKLDDEAWERAVGDYLSRFGRMSDIQDDHPLPLSDLESAPLGA